MEVFLKLQEKKDTAELQAQSKQKKKEIEQAELATKEALDQRDAAVVVIGNYVHDSVPVSADEVRKQKQTTCNALHSEAIANQLVDC